MLAAPLRGSRYPKRSLRMPVSSTPVHSRRPMDPYVLSVAAVATLGAVALGLSLAPAGGSGAGTGLVAGRTQTVRQGVTEQRAGESQSGVQAVGQAPAYGDDLNGWIKESLAIMKKHGIPGSYHGIYKNIMRESSGNPQAINNWDVNAKNGVPSIGLLQVIRPTFRAYHVPGTANSQYNPVANIVAAAHYAAARYGSIDNVNSAY
ncbi:transglycosylase SLT domain-containing protein [Streptomyces sp. NPDC051546]|uniref:transglycosylase SLT domain-containing protein n=1 Tax=Streptomyces sp. NPDC051546 TaxID=3365655 RepID=UPI0037A0B711